MRLQALNLVKSYHKKNTVNHVSFHVDNGEVVGLLGPNGAGKTTSFYILVGLIKADSGTIILDHTDITQQPMHQRARLGIGYLAQEPSIFRKLTVADNLRAVLQIRADFDEAKTETVVSDLLDEFNIAHLKDNLALGLSGGERRRVEIARALATNPQFILLDEPFAGVDPISVIDLQAMIIHLKQRGIGILITEHKVRSTLEICDRAYILNQGEIVTEGTTSQIVANKEARKVYLGNNFSL